MKAMACAMPSSSSTPAHDRVAGKVAAEELFLGAEGAHRRDALLVAVHHPIDEQERRPVWQQAVGSSLTAHSSQVDTRIAALVPPKPTSWTARFAARRTPSRDDVEPGEPGSTRVEVDVGGEKSSRIMSRLSRQLRGPAIQHSWPVIDLVDETGGTFSAESSRMALAFDPIAHRRAGCMRVDVFDLRGRAPPAQVSAIARRAPSPSGWV